MYGHQFVCLNPNHPDESTPPQIRDWLNLVYESIHNSQHPVLNTNNAGIKKAAELISFENLTPEERAASKKKEAGKITIAKIEQNARIEEKVEIAKKLIKRRLTNEEIAEDTKLSIEDIEKLRNEVV